MGGSAPPALALRPFAGDALRSLDVGAVTPAPPLSGPGDGSAALHSAPAPVCTAPGRWGGEAVMPFSGRPFPLEGLPRESLLARGGRRLPGAAVRGGG